jgi:hypothetical protein
MLNPTFLAQPPLPLLDRPNHGSDYGSGYCPEDGRNDRALNLNILIRETLEGDLIARVLEFQEWVVQATNRQEAIEKIRRLIRLKLQQEEIIPLKVDLSPLQPTMSTSMHRFAGLFKDDPDFESIHQQILKGKAETIV